MPKTRLSALWWALLVPGCADPSEPPPVRWSEQQSGTSASLRGVCAVSADVAWASGAEGTCLRTLDAGRTWRAIAVPDSRELDFRDVHATGDGRAWLLTAGTPARIYHTMDDGETWRVQYEATSDAAFFDSFAFWDARRAVVFGDPVDGEFDVLVTHDGGQSWLRLAPDALPPPTKGEAGFAASGTCVATQVDGHGWIATGGKAARVLRTTDGGQSWRATPTPMIAGWPSAGIFSVAFRDPQNGVLVGGDYLDPTNPLRNAARSGDGGATWHVCVDTPPAGYRSCVAPWPGRPGTWLAVGPDGCDESRDDGSSWRLIASVGYHSLAFEPSGKSGWAVGADGRIARVHR